MKQDTKDWLITRAARLIQGPRPRLLEGYEQVPEGTIDALMEGMTDTEDTSGYIEDDQPVDEHELRTRSMSEAMAMNGQVAGLVEHVASLRSQFLAHGFSEDSAEEMASTVWGNIIDALTED